MSVSNQCLKMLGLICKPCLKVYTQCLEALKNILKSHSLETTFYTGQSRISCRLCIAFCIGHWQCCYKIFSVSVYV